MDVEAHPTMPSFAALGKTRALPIMWAEEVSIVLINNIPNFEASQN